MLLDAGCVSPTSSHQRLQCGLPGYLILFDPHTFVPQRQLQLSKLPSLSVFLTISMHFTATPSIPPTSSVLKPCSINATLPVKPGYFSTDLQGRLRTLKPNKSGQRLPPTYYRGCWHVVSRGLFTRYLQLTPQSRFIPWQKQFTTHNAFFLHAAWLDQALTHCPIFPTAASRRSLARISVPVWGITLSGPLLIIVLVVRYTAN